MANKQNEPLAPKETWVEQMADFLTDSFGTVTFLFLNFLFFTVWIVINLGIIKGFEIFDPYPFGMLTMIVSLEAIALTIIILISQNRSSKRDQARAKADFEVNVKAEKQITSIEKKVDELLKKG